MAWVLLVLAGVMEIVMAAGLKSAAGWTKPVPAAIGVAAGLASIFLLTYAIRDLPTGTAYAVWTGIGAVGVTIVGIIAYGDSASLPRLACVALIMAGIAGLRWLEA
ncbi:DMT family transporter [Trinickia fusca]|uniref:Guanidinium exporter n=1 Tax=Trinickia fusca TaxID=2419777 RepID=A0A494XIR3_9BURK|nr:SMR family transporter [Trinickia fusca]RKP50468.1 QacE family quaternary ammonium compound efflux SMR transporter [Trinickia fusca]